MINAVLNLIRQFLTQHFNNTSLAFESSFSAFLFGLECPRVHLVFVYVNNQFCLC